MCKLTWCGKATLPLPEQDAALLAYLEKWCMSAWKESDSGMQFKGIGATAKPQREDTGKPSEAVVTLETAPEE